MRRGSLLVKILSVSHGVSPQILIKHLPYERPSARPRPEIAKKGQGKYYHTIIIAGNVK